MIEIIIIMPMIMLIGLAKTINRRKNSIKNQWDVHKKKTIIAISLTFKVKLNITLLIPFEARFNVKGCCLRSLSIKIEHVKHQVMSI